MTRSRQIPRLPAILAVLFFFTLTLSAERARGVLMIDSYSFADPWVSELSHTFRQTLSNAGRMVNYEIFQLGVRYQPGVKPVAEDIRALQARLDSGRYDLVVATNNDAGDLFIDGKLKLQKDVPLLLLRYNGALPADIQQRMNVTGLLGQIRKFGNIEFGARLLPNTRQFAVLLEASASGRRQLEAFRNLPEDLREKTLIISGSEFSTGEMLEKVAALPPDSILIYHAWSSSKDGAAGTAGTIMKQIKEVFPGLILGRLDSYMRMGVDGGVMSIGREDSRMAALMAIRLLNGERASDIPFQTGKSHKMLDYGALERHGIRKTALPGDVELVNIPPGFLTRYRNEVLWSGAIVFILLSGGVLFLLYRRISQRKMVTLFENLPLRIAVYDGSGTQLYANEIKKNSDCDIAWPESAEKRLQEAIREARDSNRHVEFDYEWNNQFRHVEVLPLPSGNPFGKDTFLKIGSNNTELHEAHLEVRRIAEELRITLESIGDGVIATDVEEHVTFMNPVAGMLTGYSLDEARGKKLDGIFNIVSYIDGGKVTSPLTEALRTGEVRELANHTDLIARDGSRRHIADCASPIRNQKQEITGGVLIFRDVTAEYEKRDYIDTQNAFLRHAADMVHMGYFQADSDGRPLHHSLLADYWGKDAAGKWLPMRDWIVPEDQDEFNAAWQSLKRRETDEIKLCYRAGAGSDCRYYEMRVKRYTPDAGSRPEFLGIIRDIQEEKQQELQMRKLLEDVRSYAEEERMLNGIFERFSAEADEEEALKLVLAEAVTSLNAFCACVFRFNDGTNRPVPAAKYQIPGAEMELPEVGLADEAGRRRELENERIYEKTNFNPAEWDAIGPEWAQYMRQAKVTSLVDAGIRLDNRLWGYIGIAFRGEVRVLNPHERNLLTSIAHIVQIILERRRTREQLRSSEMEKLLLFDKMKIPVMLFDAENNLVRVNNATFELTGATEEEMYSQPFSLTICGQPKTLPDCPILLCCADRREHVKNMQLHGRDYQMTAYPIIVDGKLVNVLATLVETTEFNKIQRKLAEALKDAENANRAKSFFLATISHELRTPLNAVIGFSELLQTEVVAPEEQLEYLQSINYAGTALLNLINDVLDLSKLEADQLNVIPGKTDVAALLAEMTAVFRLKAKEKDIALNVSSTELPPVLYVDALRLRQVLLNLIGNAVKFTHRGEVGVKVVFVPDGAENGELIIQVSDTGIGISEEDQKAIFNPFVQSYATRGNQVYEGTGLGLAISLRLVKKMNGAIDLTSVPQKGSTFTIRLAGIRYEKGETAAPAVSPADGQFTGADRVRILLVDDVVMNLKVLQAMLRKVPAACVLATSGEEALALLARDCEFDLVLTDLWMPGMNGDELAQKIHAAPGAAGIPVIAVTADSQIVGEKPEEFQDILLKPITLRTLQAIIDHYCKSDPAGITPPAHSEASGNGSGDKP